MASFDREMIILWILLPIYNQLLASSAECGTEKFAESRIVGGYAVSRKPEWIGALIRLEKDDVPNLICGVTVINSYWLVTATHCFIGSYELDDFYIVMNAERRSDIYTDDIDFLKIEKLVHRNDFHSVEPGEVLHNDLTLIKIEEPITVSPACLPVIEAIPDTECQIFGWGTTVPSINGFVPQTVPSDALQRANVNIFDFEKCSTSYNRLEISLNGTIHVCAGHELGGVDACQGDSGSPLLCPNENNQLVLYGVVSWGVGCGEAMLPGIYTNVHHFSRWIKETAILPDQNDSSTQKPAITGINQHESNDVATLDQNSWDNDHNKCKCGRVSNARITGGYYTGQGSWPWFILVLKRTNAGKHKMLCGATLINEYHALSAAHCFVSEENFSEIGYIPTERYLFQTNRYTSRMTDVVTLRAEWIRCHPSFVQMKQGLYNDICLIKFKTSIPCSADIRPVCLANELPSEGEKCKVAGFGDTTGRDHYSNVLNEGVLTVESYKYCGLIYDSPSHQAMDSLFCAQNFTYEVDTCQGDSGGPFTCPRNGTNYMFGITSFGVGCNDKKYPGAYTAVAKYLSWIKDVQENYKPCEHNHTSCGETLVKSPGILTPKKLRGNYMNNQDCRWTLRAPADMLIALRFICDFDIEAEIQGNNILCYDLLTIKGKGCFLLKYKPSLERNHAARLFCGRKKPENFIKSKTNELEIRFQSDFNDTRVGFSIEYQVSVPTQKFTSHITSVPNSRCNGKTFRAL